MEAVPVTEDDPDLQFLIKIVLTTTGHRAHLKSSRTRLVARRIWARPK